MFKITQHERDIELMKSLVEYFNCGNIRSNKATESSSLNKQAENGWIDFTVEKYEDIASKIIPFFSSYKIIGIKHLDFEDFKQVVEIMKTKEHLTNSGLEKIIEIKKSMNKGRSW